MREAEFCTEGDFFSDNWPAEDLAIPYWARSMLDLRLIVSKALCLEPPSMLSWRFLEMVCG